jgi:hypothetical protein
MALTLTGGIAAAYRTTPGLLSRPFCRLPYIFGYGCANRNFGLRPGFATGSLSSRLWLRNLFGVGVRCESGTVLIVVITVDERLAFDAGASARWVAVRTPLLLLFARNARSPPFILLASPSPNDTSAAGLVEISASGPYIPLLLSRRGHFGWLEFWWTRDDHLVVPGSPI